MELFMSLYGSTPLSKEQDYNNRVELYKYIEAKINAEKINPQRHYDYDNEIGQKLLEEIAVSDLTANEREALVKLLNK